MKGTKNYTACKRNSAIINKECKTTRKEKSGQFRSRSYQNGS